jgi:hypothetical protein
MSKKLKRQNLESRKSTNKIKSKKWN